MIGGQSHEGPPSYASSPGGDGLEEGRRELEIDREHENRWLRMARWPIRRLRGTYRGRQIEKHGLQFIYYLLATALTIVGFDGYSLDHTEMSRPSNERLVKLFIQRARELRRRACTLQNWKTCTFADVYTNVSTVVKFFFRLLSPIVWLMLLVFVGTSLIVMIGISAMWEVTADEPPSHSIVAINDGSFFDTSATCTSRTWPKRQVHQGEPGSDPSLRSTAVSMEDIDNRVVIYPVGEVLDARCLRHCLVQAAVVSNQLCMSAPAMGIHRRVLLLLHDNKDGRYNRAEFADDGEASQVEFGIQLLYNPSFAPTWGVGKHEVRDRSLLWNIPEKWNHYWGGELTATSEAGVSVTIEVDGTLAHCVQKHMEYMKRGLDV